MEAGSPGPLPNIRLRLDLIHNSTHDHGARPGIAVPQVTVPQKAVLQKAVPHLFFICPVVQAGDIFDR